MKHCPQCEFTFDDQVQFCDFDGTELSLVPEQPPAFKTVRFAPTASRSFMRRLVKSHAALSALALAGVALSALVIGHYDSVIQSNVDMPFSQTRNDQASDGPSTKVDEGLVETQADRPRIISTQRKIGADELPPSMVKRLLQSSSSRSAKSRVGPSSPNPVTAKRGPSSSKLAVIHRKPAQATRQSHVRNPTRLVPRDRARQQHSVAREATRRPASGANESAHHRNDSRVIAILKKTGSILKKPFVLIADR